MRPVAITLKLQRQGYMARHTTDDIYFILFKLLKLLEEKSHSNVLFSTLLHPQDLVSRLGRCLLAAVCTVVLTGLGKTKVYGTSNSLRTK